MTKYCLAKWDANKDKLRKRFEEGTGWNVCGYVDILKAIVETVLNEGEPAWADQWDSSHIAVIDDGAYQGTLLFLIPLDTYQPEPSEYLITYVDYGSCCGCDTLQGIQAYGSYGDKLTEKQIDDFMLLSKDILMTMRKPFNDGWRHDERFDEVAFDDRDI